MHTDSGAGWLFCQEDKWQLSRRSGLPLVETYELLSNFNALREKGINMTAELLVNVTPSETRVGILMAVFCRKFILNVRRDAESRQYLQGSCKSCTSGYAGGFVDIGLDKAAFLHASDIMPHMNVWRVKNKSNSRCATSRNWPSGARSDGAGGERSAWH